jgi:alpha-tubulin suppressor-like RCC1 family protein
MFATSQVYSNGYNSLGQLGNGQATMRTTPTIVDVLYGIPILDIAAGGEHTLVVSKSFDVWGFGGNSVGMFFINACRLDNLASHL